MEETKLKQVIFQSYDKSFSRKVDGKNLQIGGYFNNLEYTLKNIKEGCLIEFEDADVYIFPKGTSCKTIDLIAQYFNASHPVVLKRIEDKMLYGSHFYEIYYEVGILDIPELLEKLDERLKDKIDYQQDDLLELLEYEKDFTRITFADFRKYLEEILPRLSHILEWDKWDEYNKTYRKYGNTAKALEQLFYILVERAQYKRMEDAAFKGETEKLNDLLEDCFDSYDNLDCKIRVDYKEIKKKFFDTFVSEFKKNKKEDMNFCLLLCGQTFYKGPAHKDCNFIQDITHLIPEEKSLGDILVIKDIFLDYYRAEGDKEREQVINHMLNDDFATEIYKWASKIKEAPIVSAFENCGSSFLIYNNKTYRVPAKKRYGLMYHIDHLVPDNHYTSLFLNYYITDGTKEQDKIINQMREHENAFEIYDWACARNEISILSALRSERIHDLKPYTESVKELFIKYYHAHSIEQQQDYINEMITHEDVLYMYCYAMSMKEDAIVKAVKNSISKLNKKKFNEFLKKLNHDYQQPGVDIIICSVHYLFKKEKYLEALEIVAGTKSLGEWLSESCANALEKWVDHMVAHLMMDKDKVIPLLTMIDKSLFLVSEETKKFKWLKDYNEFINALRKFMPSRYVVSGFSGIEKILMKEENISLQEWWSNQEPSVTRCIIS